MKIVKQSQDPVIDFAAQELKKYLRMMMPQKGEIEITTTGTDGFRLGLLTDFGKYDWETENYFDFGLAAKSMWVLLNKKPVLEI